MLLHIHSKTKSFISCSNLYKFSILDQFSNKCIQPDQSSCDVCCPNSSFPYIQFEINDVDCLNDDIDLSFDVQNLHEKKNDIVCGLNFHNDVFHKNNKVFVTCKNSGCVWIDNNNNDKSNFITRFCVNSQSSNCFVRLYFPFLTSQENVILSWILNKQMKPFNLFTYLLGHKNSLNDIEKMIVV